MKENTQYIIVSCIAIILISISLSECFKWAARAESKLPKETALHKSYNYKGNVIIVGAGAAGLAAAKVSGYHFVDKLLTEQ